MNINLRQVENKAENFIGFIERVDEDRSTFKVRLFSCALILLTN